MAVTVNQVQKSDPKKSFLDRTIDALNIANSASGIYKNLGGSGTDSKVVPDDAMSRRKMFLEDQYYNKRGVA